MLLGLAVKMPEHRFALIHYGYHILACVASVPVQAEEIFAFGTRQKWARTKKKSKESNEVGKKGTFPSFPSPSPPPPSSFLLSPHSPLVLNEKTPSRGPIFRSACTGTLATQAKQRRMSGSCRKRALYES